MRSPTLPLLRVTKAHVKLWSQNRAGGIFGAVQSTRRKQSILCGADGCGVFGLKLDSDANERYDALEDNQISVDHANDAEVSGVEIASSAAAGVFLFGSQRTFIDGNYIHHTWADHVHHTDGARSSWVWGNWILNEAPSNGDDGVACVTYGPTSPKCGDMEWWKNTILKTGWGRGYSVIGGDHIRIHDNWGMYVAGAGTIVASEPSYDSASSNDIVASGNKLHRCAQFIGHPGILVSGDNDKAPPLTKLTFDANVVAETKSGQAHRTEGSFTEVTNTGMSTVTSDLGALPTAADVKLRDTTILATRDVAWVEATSRRGLHRVQVRKGASGFEQRFEYVVRGAKSDVDAFAAGGCVIERKDVAGKSYVLLVASAPLAAPTSLEEVTMGELRAGDLDGTLAWLWKRVDALDY